MAYLKGIGSSGRPRVPNHPCVDAIFFALRTGCQWAALSQIGLCAKSTAHDCFQAWGAAGIFQKLWQTGVAQFDELPGVDWEWLPMNAALTKVALGGKGGTKSDRSRRG